MSCQIMITCAMFHKTAGTRSSIIKSICVIVILLLILPVALMSMIVGCSDVSQRVNSSATEVTVQTKIEPTAVSTTSSAAEDSTINLSGVVPLSRPRSASAVSVSPDGKLVIAVNPDNNSITLIDAINLVVLTEIPVGDTPRTLSITPDSENVLVANYGSATISKVNISLAEEVAQFPVGSMPYGVVTDGVNAFITEFGLGTISKIDLITGKLLSRTPVDAFPSGLALSRDGQRLFITHFSPASSLLLTKNHSPRLERHLPEQVPTYLSLSPLLPMGGKLTFHSHAQISRTPLFFSTPPSSQSSTY